MDRDLLDRELMPSQEKIARKDSTILELPPSCLEFSPRYPDYVVVGTYNLQKEDNDASVSETEVEDEPKKAQSRDGSLLLFRVHDGRLEMVFKVSHHAAILDLHFCPESKAGRDMFVVANSVGQVSLYELQISPSPRIVAIKDFLISDPSTLVLSCAWHEIFSDILGVTLSTGTATLLRFNEDMSEIETVREDINPHTQGRMSLECWTIAFSPASFDKQYGKKLSQGIYTGGDDSKLRCTIFLNESHPDNPFEESSAVAPGGTRGLPGHDAGVTAILPLPLNLPSSEDIILTGSYDDHIRVYSMCDRRNSSTGTIPAILADLNLGGGVWRLKLISSLALPADAVDKGAVYIFKVLASCMHAGVRILEIKGSIAGDWSIQVLASFCDHKSMNYASDVQPAPARQDKVLCVSSSFYDRLLCVWTYDDTQASSGNACNE